MSDTTWKASTTAKSTATLAAATEFRVVDDPAGTPTSKKTTAGAIKTYINGLANTWSAAQTVSVAGAASTPAMYLTGAVLTGGTGTTNFPHIFYQPSGATASSTWSTAGTAFGANMPVGFTGNPLDLQVAGNRVVGFDYQGTWLPTYFNIGVGRVISFSSGPELLGNNANSLQVRNNAETASFFLTVSAAAVMQLGIVNAASPVAQTVQSQGSRSGTDSNVGGANLTIQSGTGTGTGTISSLTLKSPVAVASGTGAQTMTAGLSITAGTAVLTSYTVASLPAANTAGAGATAFVTDASTTLILGLGGTVTGGGSNKVPVYSDGTNWIYG